MNEISANKKSFGCLLGNENRRENVFEHWRINNPDRYLTGIERLCTLKKFREAARLVRDYPEACAATAKSMILKSIDEDEASGVLELFYVLLELRCKDRLLPFLNAEISAGNNRNELFQASFSYGEEGRYDMVFWLLELLSQCENLSLLNYFLHRQRGLDYYKKIYKERIGQIVRNVWGRADYEILMYLIYKLRISDQLPFYLEMEREDLLDKLCRKATKASFHIAFYMFVAKEGKKSADRLLLNRMEHLQETEDVLITRWYHMFNGCRKGSIDIRTLTGFLTGLPRIAGLNSHYHSVTNTVCVLAMFIAENNMEAYLDILSALGKNNLFITGNGINTVNPCNIYRYFDNETKAQNLRALTTLYQEKYLQNQRGFLEYYLNSCFKYTVKLRDVLNLLFPPFQEVNPNIFKGLKFRYYINRVSKNEERMILSGNIYDCMADTVFIQIDKDKPIMRGRWYELSIDTFIPRTTVNDGLRYRALYLEENKTELPILSRKPEYDKLFKILDHIIKDRRIRSEDIENLKAINCPVLKGIYVQHFYRYIAQILNCFSKDLDTFISLLTALNENDINPCNLEKYPDRIEPRRELTEDKELSIHLQETLMCWKNWDYRKNAAYGLQTGEKMTWIYMNSCMRFCIPLNEFLQCIRRYYISERTLLKVCFGKYTFSGILYQNNGELRMPSVSMRPKLSPGYRLRYMKKELSVIEKLPDRTKILFSLYNIKDNVIEICNIREIEHDYRELYESILKYERLISAIEVFRKKELWRYYTYSQLLHDWCQKHLEKSTLFYHIPFCGRAKKFIGSYAADKFIVNEIQSSENIVVENPELPTTDPQRKYELLLYGYDIASQTLYFELWE